MQGPYRQPTFTCVTCELEIDRPPVIHVGLPFCCAGCVAGGPCTCSYDEEAGSDRPTAEIIELDAALADDESGVAVAVR